MSNMLYVLGARLAQVTGQNEVTCRGMLRLSVMDSVEHLQQTSDPNQTVAYLATMAYQDWKAIVEGPVLARRLANAGIREPTSAVAQLKQTLIEKQSLLTMSAR